MSLELIERLLPSSCLELENLPGQLKLEVILAVMKSSRKKNTHVLEENVNVTFCLSKDMWKAILDFWVRLIAATPKPKSVVVPVLNFTKSVWKSGELRCRQTITSHYTELARLCDGCLSNLELKKLFHICFLILSSLEDEKDLATKALQTTLRHVLSLEHVVVRFSQWMDVCVLCAGDEVTTTSPERDCSDQELLPAFVRSLLILLLQCAFIYLSTSQPKGDLVSIASSLCDGFVKAVKTWSEKNNFIGSVSDTLGSVLLAVVSDNDDTLLKALHLCTLMYKHGKDKLSCFPPSCASFLSACSPHKMFISFLNSVSFDPIMLMEFIASGDKEFVIFFHHYLEYSLTSWNELEAVCFDMDVASNASRTSTEEGTESDSEDNFEVGMGFGSFENSPLLSSTTSSKKMCLQDISQLSSEETPSAISEDSTHKLPLSHPSPTKRLALQDENICLAKYVRCLIHLRLKLDNLLQRGLISEEMNAQHCNTLIDKIERRYFSSP
jgi:hypothetical protein